MEKCVREMYTLTAADFADTGQWRLLINIGHTGLEAFLENTLHPELGLQFLCRADWEADKTNLYSKLEDAVYNNPRLLDDFATRITLFDLRTLFIPKEVAEDTVGAEEEIYKKVFEAQSRDIMTASYADITAIWEFAPGVKSFLMRTFPGAKITCNLLEKIKSIREKNPTETCLSVYARPKEADFILIDKGELISASTHLLNRAEDIRCMADNLLDAYGYTPGGIKLNVEGIEL